MNDRETPAQSSQSEGDPLLRAWIAEHAAKTPPTRLSVKNDGSRDIAFTGWLIGDGRYEGRKNIVAQIYMTVNGTAVISIAKADGMQWDFSSTVVEKATPEAMLEALGIDTRFGEASRDAWNEACKYCPPLAREQFDEIQ